MTYVRGEEFLADIEIAHFGPTTLKGIMPEWVVTSASGRVLRSGKLKPRDIAWGTNNLGRVQFRITDLPVPARYRFSVRVGKAQNDWSFWVYPRAVSSLDDSRIMVGEHLDSTVAAYLDQGGSVLLSLGRGRVRGAYGGDIALGFSSIFWNTVWTKGQAPHTLGILCDPSHPALASFPTDFHSDWQWWDIIAHADPLVLDSIAPLLQPVVRIIDDWNMNRNLALLFEVRVGRGRLMVSGADLMHDLERRPEAQQLRYSLIRYMQGSSLRQVTEAEIDVLRKAIQ
jgi:hypothetical protein